MVLRTIPFRPGEVRDDEQLAAEGYAASTQLIEWVRQRAQTWPGWATISSSNSIGSAARGIGAFANLDALAFLGLGTLSRLWVYYPETNGSVYNITPDRDATALGLNPITTTAASSSVVIALPSYPRGNPNITAGTRVRVGGIGAVGGVPVSGTSRNLSAPFTTTLSSDLISVRHSAHGLAAGDGVSFPSTHTVGDIVISGFYDVVSVTNASNYRIQHTTASLSAATGGSTPLVKVYNSYTVSGTSGLTITIAAGTNATIGTTAGGSGGEIRIEVNDNGSRHWAITNYRDTMIACPRRGGPISQWFTNGAARARFLTNSPAEIAWALVTPEGALMALGCNDASTGAYDPLRVRWSDLDDINNWTASSTSNAGSLRLGQGSTIVGALNTLGGTLCWTDTSLYFIRYTGNEDAQYVAELVGTGCGLVGALAAIEQDGIAFWISPAGQCFVYSGGRPRPLPNPNERYFRDNLNNNIKSQIVATFDVTRSAVMWLWPFTGATENNRYMRCNLLENARDPNAGWGIGTLDRTVWLDRGVFTNPIAVSSSGLIYIHDSGRSDNGSPLTRSLERAPFDISDQETGDGGVKAVIRRMVFGRTHSGATLTAQLIGRDWEIDSTPQTKTFTFATSTPYVDARMQARQVAFRWQTTGSNDFLREGNIRLDISKGTRR